MALTLIWHEPKLYSPLDGAHYSSTLLFRFFPQLTLLSIPICNQLQGVQVQRNRYVYWRRLWGEEDVGLRRDEMLVSRLPWPPNPQQVILTVNSTLPSNFTLALVMDDNASFALHWRCSLSYSTELQCSGNQICTNYSLNHTKKKMCSSWSWSSNSRFLSTLFYYGRGWTGLTFSILLINGLWAHTYY